MEFTLTLLAAFAIAQRSDSKGGDWIPVIQNTQSTRSGWRSVPQEDVLRSITRQSSDAAYTAVGLRCTNPTCDVLLQSQSHLRQLRVGIQIVQYPLDCPGCASSKLFFQVATIKLRSALGKLGEICRTPLKHSLNL